MNQKSDSSTSTLQETYSRFALQILSSYHDWREWGDAPPLHLRESEMLQKGPYEIWKQALALSGDDNLGLNAGMAFVQHANGHFLTTLVANSTTVGDALKNFCNYHSVYSEALHPELNPHANTMELSIANVGDVVGDQVMRQMGECLFSAIVTTLSATCKKPIIPTKVCFSWSAPTNVTAHKSVFKAPIFFDAEKTFIEFSLDTLETLVPYTDSLLLATLTHYADSQLNAMQENDSWANKVRSIICHSNGSLDIDIETVAGNLSIGHRVLQKKLKAEGTSYQNIVREIKVSIGKEYLSNNAIPLTEIALMLGYSEQSAFNHAFKQWTGQTPRQFRETSIKNQTS